MQDKINLIIESTQAKTKFLLTEVLPLIILFIMFIWHLNNNVNSFLSVIIAFISFSFM